MICKIAYGDNFSGIINYHEKKLQEGECILLSKSIPEDDPKKYMQEFNRVCAKNPKALETKVTHFSISLDPSENLSDQQITALAMDYLEKRGYGNCPNLIYRHFDTDHPHIHIVTTGVDYDGKRVDTFRDQIKNKEVCRALETTYLLTQVDNTNQTKTNLNEINAKKYSLQNAILKAYQHPLEKQEVDTLVQIDSDLLTKPCSNHELRAQIGTDKYNKVYQLLNDKGYIYKTNKDKITEALESCYQSAKTKEEFLTKIDDNNLYIRELGTINKKYFVYGAQNLGYFHQKHLPKKLSHESVSNLHLKQAAFTKEQQRKYLSNMVSKAVVRSKNVDQFIENLKLNKIEPIFAKNSGGIYGCSFRQIDSPEVFKGSELDRKLSWNNITANFELNNTKANEAYKAKIARIETIKGKKEDKSTSKPSELPKALKGVKKLANASDSEEQLRNSKKSTDQGIGI